MYKHHKAFKSPSTAQAMDTDIKSKETSSSPSIASSSIHTASKSTEINTATATTETTSNATTSNNVEATATNTTATKKKSRKRKYTDSGNGDKKDSSQPPNKKKKRGWSDEEEKLYQQGLELFGRDWKALAAHVGHGRNAASIRSHSQIHFLRLLSEGKSLPAKVAESGIGYTLSGAPLNKYSSIALRHFGSADKVPIMDGAVISDQEAAESNKRPKKDATGDGENKQKKEKKEKAVKNAKKKAKKNKYYDSTDEDEEDEDIYRTFNSLSTSSATTTTAPRRSGRACTKNRFTKGLEEALHETDPYGLRTDIEHYTPFIPPSTTSANDEDEQDERVESQSASNKKKKCRSNKKDHSRYRQPFDIVYCPNALCVADVHSHLCSQVEIMGLLGGKYDAAKRVLYVLKCYPIREEEQDEHTVSADAGDQFAVSERMRNEDNLELVGWYHSHPCFENVPSNTDCHQHFMQKHEDELAHPYVGLIIASWSTMLVDCGQSQYRFFNSLKEYRFVYTPLEFRTRCQVFTRMHDECLMAQISELVDRYSQSKYDVYRVDFGEEWQHLSKLEKLLQSVRCHAQIEHAEKKQDGDEQAERVEDDGGHDRFVKQIESLFVTKKNVWWMTNIPRCADGDDQENKNSFELIHYLT